MATFANISTTSASPTTLYSDSANPIKIIFVQSDATSNAVATVYVTSEKSISEDAITIPAGSAVPISRDGGITGVVAYSTGTAVTLYTGIISK